MSEVQELDGVQVREVIDHESRGVVIDFWSPWCGPCRVLRPHLHRLAEELAETWRFVAVNTEAHPFAAESFGVRALPTLVLFREGEEVDRLAGAITLSGLVGRLEAHAAL